LVLAARWYWRLGSAGGTPSIGRSLVFVEKNMSADEPFALHITWTCYGTWLPGDQRGHVSNVLLPQ
jgi:hypothetical protein